MVRVALVILLLSSINPVFGSILNNSKSTVIEHTESSDSHKDGFWSQNVTWKSRWVKYWRTKAIYVPVWKKVWGPIVQNEWVPLPNAPPGWQNRGLEKHIKSVDS
ncbi:uncharacterized protein LOC119675142 [Teleopsis dalmanni]|uniref:uncharacterized protein LOC119675142 n=1 Tax=Teleopsis dalmanni TaxID=139649 RepID=UPI0018CD7B9C|nr:uncharacterized protein LOC119675142 [Teleopsis dalmanni]